MEKNNNYYLLSFLIISIFIIFAGVIFLSADLFDIHAFRLIFHIISVLLFTFAALMLLGFLGVQNILLNKDEVNSSVSQDKASKKKTGALFLTRIALKYFMPVILTMCDFFRFSKDDIRRVYIAANNKYINSLGLTVIPEKLLVLLPHCLQSSNCAYRIRNSLDNCQQCSSCNIGDIKSIVTGYGVNVEIATGGTSARKAIFDKKPEFVIAVACERDLTSGLIDIKDIPVYGILNQRPNGPCKDTYVDIDLLEKTITRVTGVSGDQQTV